MLIEHKLSNLAKIGDGKLIGQDSNFSKISTDTRSIEKGDIFLALKGVNYDGHDYLDEAIDKGAICLISEKILKLSISYIKTSSTKLFLEKTAKAQRKLFNGKVVAITGSNGKTSTKQILSDLLENFYPEGVFKSPGNWNNKLGLYYSLLEVDKSHQLAIFELGTNAKGEIKDLSSFLNPDIGAITNIGRSHLEGLSDIDGVMEEKTDLFNSVKSDGNCLIRIKKDFLSKAREKSGSKNLIILDESDRLSFDQNMEMALSIISSLNDVGGQNFYPTKNEIKHVEEYFSVSGRQQIKMGKNKVTIMDDTYNANPDSFYAAFKKIKSLNFKKKICVMGSMSELGENYQFLQNEIIKSACDTFDLVIALEIETECDFKNLKIISSNQIKETLSNFLNEDSIVLFKASRSVRMEKIVQLFL
ncbi:UDP-N-acetylmuramoyl-tripeptide--D-alanyl-D-alanine ligase [SAR86 cluster bacterium]|nr:UDP-N-acetylmuramoyl-tripeptide--D-alanyl-D-alanine ligase [SAR86 cluster bacterium]